MSTQDTVWIDLEIALKERDEARAECERLRADAERYRWLSDHPESIPYQDEMGFWYVEYISGALISTFREENLDAAIDAARGGK